MCGSFLHSNHKFIGYLMGDSAVGLLRLQILITIFVAIPLKSNIQNRRAGQFTGFHRPNFRLLKKVIQIGDFLPSISAAYISPCRSTFYYTCMYFRQFFFSLSFCRFIALFNFCLESLNCRIFCGILLFFIIIFKYMHELCVDWCLYSQWINIHETRNY